MLAMSLHLRLGHATEFGYEHYCYTEKAMVSGNRARMDTNVTIPEAYDYRAPEGVPPGYRLV
jgi:hypothetical protein